MAQKAASSDEAESRTYSGGEDREVAGEAWAKSRLVEFSSGPGSAGGGGGVVACYEPFLGFAPFLGGIFSDCDASQSPRGCGSADGEQSADDSDLLYDGLSCGGGDARETCQI